MSADGLILSSEGMRRFTAQRALAIESVTARFYQEHSSLYAQFGESGRTACREDLGYHLEFLAPVLEFGVCEPMVRYLRWLAAVLDARGIPSEHLTLSLDWLAEFFAGCMETSDAARITRALSSVKSAFLASAEAAPTDYVPMPSAWPDCADFENAVLNGDLRGAAEVIERNLAQGRSLVDAELHIIQPALYRVGSAWQANKISIAQEHLATAVTQWVMVQGLLKTGSGPRNGNKALFACVEGNQHVVGLQMVADAFQLAHWDVSYLGANVPTTALIQHVRMSKPVLLGLSVSFPHQLRVVKDIMAGLNNAFGADRPSVIVGGLAINNFPGLADKLGVDAWSPDAAAAVAAGGQLVARRST
jgi:methanogenic corrinoid protein MtbC1